MLGQENEPRPQSTPSAIEGRRTVLQLAAYLQHLKELSREYEASFAVTHRGYFDACEEERTLGLLVSYHQTRLALHELIDEMTAGSEVTPWRFVLGFASALLLVDAARHFRGLAEGRPAVRRKFNQPAPEFGLHGGLYDEVQASLLSVRNVWRLRSAARTYRRNRQRFLQDATVWQGEAVIELIDELLLCIQVRKRSFLSAKLRTWSDQSMRAFGRRVFARSLYGLQKFGSSHIADVYVRPGHVPSLSTRVRNEVLALARPGDVFVVRKEFALTNYFLPGYWPHAALYLGRTPSDAEPSSLPRVLEAMKDGVQLRSVDSPFGCDSIVIIRPQLPPSAIESALRRALQHEGKPYDFDFDFSRADRLVCTEVVYRAYQGVGEMAFPLVHRAGRPTLSGPDLLGMARRRLHFVPVACHMPTQGDGLLHGEEVDAVLDAHGGTAETSL